MTKTSLKTKSYAYLEELLKIRDEEIETLVDRIVTLNQQLGLANALRDSYKKKLDKLTT